MSNEELVQLIKQGMDPAGNMEQLYIQNQGMIYVVVKRYSYACQSDHNGTPIIEVEELMHEAYLGLLKAVESYDTGQGVLFMSYAPYWLKRAVKRYLENCGQAVRVPVHKQAQVYQYNQATSCFLRRYNRQPSVKEYATWLGVSEKAVEQLQRFMFQSKIKSLDIPLTGSDNDEITIIDTIASEVDIENEITERLSRQQLYSELWKIVIEELKDEKALQILKMKYEDNMTSKDIALLLNDDYKHVNSVIRKHINLLRKNGEIRYIGKELGLIDYGTLNIRLLEKNRVEMRPL